MTFSLRKSLTIGVLAALAALATILSLVFASSSQAAPSGKDASSSQKTADANSATTQILRNGVRVCSGLLIREKKIETNADCVAGVPTNQLTVRVGSLEPGKGVLRAVKSAKAVKGDPQYSTDQTKDLNNAVITLYTGTNLAVAQG